MKTIVRRIGLVAHDAMKKDCVPRSTILFSILITLTVGLFTGLGRGSCQHSDPRCMGSTDRGKLFPCHGKSYSTYAS